MDNKVIVKLVVPELDSQYDVYLPVNKRIGNILVLLNKGLNEITKGKYPIVDKLLLFNGNTRECYDINALLINTNIRNGTVLILVS